MKPAYSSRPNHGTFFITGTITFLTRNDSRSACYSGHFSNSMEGLSQSQDLHIQGRSMNIALNHRRDATIYLHKYPARVLQCINIINYIKHKLYCWFILKVQIIIIYCDRYIDIPSTWMIAFAQSRSLLTWGAH